MTIYDIDTNQAGREFLKDKKILGVETKQDSRRELYVAFMAYNGKPYFCVVPQSDGTTSPCYFGDLEYFATVHACDVAGIMCHWKDNGRPAWPKWFIDFDDPQDSAQWDVFIKTYKNTINKYNNNK